MSVTPEEVSHIAALARLRLESDEVARMSHELNAILGHIEALARVDVSDVPPLTGVVDGTTPLRPDAVGADPLQRPPESMAPAFVAPFFVVPRLSALDAEALNGEDGA